MHLNTISRHCGIALLLLVSACIPSKSETESAPKPKDTAIAPAPKAAESPAPAYTPLPVEPAPPAESAPPSEPAAEENNHSSNMTIPLDELNNKAPVEFDENDPLAVAKRSEEQALSNGGVMLYTADDGVGFKIKGANGFTATLKPDASGETWTFDGEFVAMTEGLKVGKEEITTVVDGVPSLGQKDNTLKGLYMIVIPIQLPDINAIETGDTYRVPVHFNVKAAANAQFIVNTMPTTNL